MAPNPSSAPFTSTYSDDETTSTGDGFDCPFFNITKGTVQSSTENNQILFIRSVSGL
jgi:hypothetical protein